MSKRAALLRRLDRIERQYHRAVTDRRHVASVKWRMFADTTRAQLRALPTVGGHNVSS
jgi:hypothetical protein